MTLEMGKEMINRRESLRDSHTFCLRRYRGARVRWRSVCRLYLEVALRRADQDLLQVQRRTNIWAKGMPTSSSSSGKSGG